MSDIRRFFQNKTQQKNENKHNTKQEHTTTPAKSTSTKRTAPASSSRKKRVIESDNDDDEEFQESPFFKETGGSGARGRKSPRTRSAIVVDDDTDVDEENKDAAKKPTPRSRKKNVVNSEVEKEAVQPASFFGNKKPLQVISSMVDEKSVGGKNKEASAPTTAPSSAKRKAATLQQTAKSQKTTTGSSKAASSKGCEDEDEDDPFESLDIDDEALIASTQEVEERLKEGVKKDTDLKTPKSVKNTPEKAVNKASKPEESEDKKKSPEKTPAIPIKKAAPANNEDQPAAKKKSFRDFKARTGPAAPGSKDIPEGAENCLANLCFCFTGEMSSISREDATDLVKRYGARVVGAPSGKTDYVVIGDDAGESKLKKVEALKIKTLDEDGLFDLVRNSKPKTAVTSTPVSAKGKGKATASSPTQPQAPVKSTAIPAASSTNDGQLWADRYKPKTYKDIVGNSSNVQALANWLKAWPTQRANGFAKTQRAVLLSGPPGIGKTTTAHLVCNLEGYEISEFNASDVRSKKSLEASVMDTIRYRTITEFYNSEKKGSTAGKPQAVIMDEVDGMSAGDRGGMAELVGLIKKTKVPIICICNDRSSPKVRTLASYCLDLRFRRATPAQCRSRLMSIAFKENLKIDGNSVDQLVSATSSDIRQVLTLMSSYRLNEGSMNYDQSKALTKSSQKSTIKSPFQMAEETLIGNHYKNQSLSEKINIYFNDFSLAPLMIQENYIQMNPNRVDRNVPKRMQDIQHMDLIANAAEAISDGDLMDRLIHTQQHWSLMPAHSAFSCVRPASFVHGGRSGGGFGFGFPSWLGQNSKASKGQRLLRELQVHLRLRISGDRFEVRQSYLPMLVPKLTKPMVSKGQDGIDDVIDIMDHYYISREDWEAVLELGMGPLAGDEILKKIPSAVKSAFTRKYNKTNHPVAVATVIKNAGKKGSGGGSTLVPDSEEAVKMDDDEDGGGDDEDDDSVAADALVRKKSAPSKAAAGKAASGSKGARGKRKSN